MTNGPPDPRSPDSADVADRLRALGRTPVDPAVASAHLTAMNSVGAKPDIAPARGRFVHAKIAAAFAAGLVLGGTSLASAGALGNAPQDAVADTAAHVGLDLPGGAPRSAEGCGGKTYKNHGAFVSQGGDPHSTCGKPLKSTEKHDKPQGKHDKSMEKHDEADGAREAKGCGKPPWAGKGNHDKKTPTAVAVRRAACGDNSPETEHAPAGAAAPKPNPTTATTTPEPTATTSTTSAGTTTTTTTTPVTTSTTTTTP